jgi:glucuronokinase
LSDVKERGEFMNKVGAKTITAKAFARAALAGNPSDGYFGKTISCVVRNFSAKVQLRESGKLAFSQQEIDDFEFSDLDDLERRIRARGYYGATRLLKAACVRFGVYCRDHGIDLPKKNFSLSCSSDIPFRVGMAGSSAIVTATMRALMRHYRIEIPKPTLPNLILQAETEELGIPAGLQDRVVQVYEGLVFMDFREAHFTVKGHGVYESIGPALLPPLFLAYAEDLSEGSEVTHSNLLERYRRGDPEIVDAMEQWASLAQNTRDLIVSGKGNEIGPLMDANADLRIRLLRMRGKNRALISTARKNGAWANFTGSGGAVIGCYDGDPERLRRLRAAFAVIGSRCIIPKVGATRI